MQSQDMSADHLGWFDRDTVANCLSRAPPHHDVSCSITDSVGIDQYLREKTSSLADVGGSIIR